MMHRIRRGLPSLLAVALLVPATAWAQDAPGKDVIEKAIQVLKASAERSSYDLPYQQKLLQARRDLRANRGEALPHVVMLLDENDIQIRLNAAVALAEFAEAGEPRPALIKALRRCLDDTDLAVAYWGMTGLVADGVSGSDRVAAITAGLDMKRPRGLRIVAAQLASAKKITGAVPAVIRHLQTILPAYKKQVTAKLTVKVGKSTGRGRAGGERPSGRGDRVPERGRGEAVEKVPTRVINPDTEFETKEEIETLAGEFEQIPTVAELHQIGLAVELLVDPNPFRSPFHFGTTPPWRLDECVNRAVVWLNNNKDKFKTRPAAPEAEPKEK